MEEQGHREELQQGRYEKVTDRQGHYQPGHQHPEPSLPKQNQVLYSQSLVKLKGTVERFFLGLYLDWTRKSTSSRF